MNTATGSAARDGRDSTGPFAVTCDAVTGIAQVELRGTSSGNAMGSTVWSGLPALVADLEADDSIRAVVLRGAGDCFTVGLDLRWYALHYRRLVAAGDGPRMRQILLDEAKMMQMAISAVTSSRLPYVAAVHGACVGAGLDLASACDIRLASRDAYFSLREVRIGIVADLGSLQRLPGLIGAGLTRELALTGRDLSAEEAFRYGLVTEVADTPEELFARARRTATVIAGYPPQVIAGIKDVLEQTSAHSVPDGLRYVAVWNAAFLPSPELPGLLGAALRDSSAQLNPQP